MGFFLHAAFFNETEHFKTLEISPYCIFKIESLQKKKKMGSGKRERYTII